jgi:hypothetical protein
VLATSDLEAAIALISDATRSNLLHIRSVACAFHCLNTLKVTIPILPDAAEDGVIHYYVSPLGAMTTAASLPTRLWRPATRLS